jgi:hypothetical protein
LVERPMRGGGEGLHFVLFEEKKATQKNWNGHQFKGHYIRIVKIEARCAAQSIVDILGHSNWCCDVGHCVAVSKNFVPPKTVCIKSEV